MRAPTYTGPGWHSSVPGVWRLLDRQGRPLGPAVLRLTPGQWVHTCDGASWGEEGMPIDLAMQAAQGLPTDTHRPQENGR